MHTVMQRMQCVTLISAAAMLAMATRPAMADFTWDGGAVDDLWTSDDNWVGDVAPGTDIGDMLLIFGPTGGAQNPDAGNDNYTGITGIRWTGADATLRLLGTGSLTFTDGAEIINDSAFAQVVEIDIVGTGDLLIFDAMSESLTFTSDIDLSDSGGVMLTVRGDNNTNISGVISGDGASILKEGDGLLALQEANTFTGGVELAGGGLIIGDDEALGTGTLTITGDGSTIESNDDTRSFENNINIADVELIITGNNDIAHSGIMSGAGSLTIDMDDATSIVNLETRNTYAGGTDLRRGTVLIGDNRAFGGGDITVKGDSTIQSSANNRRVNNNIEIRSTRSLTFGGSNNLRLFGTISGLGSLVVDTDGSADSLTLFGNNTFEGGVVLNNGVIELGNNNALGTGDLRLTGNGRLRSSSNFRTISNRIRLEDNTLSIRGENNLTIDGKISGSGGLLIRFESNDAMLTLTREDNTYSGLTDVERGILSLEGGVAGDVTVRDRGTLISNGTIGGNLLIEEDGVVAPGVGIETLTVDGDFTLSDGAIFELEIGVDDSEQDVIAVGGMATLADGSMIDASVSGSTYVANGASFDILTADGGITDDGVEVMTDSATITFTLVPDPDFTDGDMTFALVVTREATAYSDPADAGNNLAIGLSLDSIQPFADADPDGGAASLLGALDALDEDAYNAALDQLSPEPYNAAVRLGVETARVFNHELSRYLAARRTGIGAWNEQQRLIMPRPGALAMAHNDPAILAAALAQVEDSEDDMDEKAEDGRRYSVFGQFHGSFIDQDSSGNRTGFDGEVFGGQAGIDWEVNPNLIVGLAIGFSHAEGDWNNNSGSIEDDVVRAGPYVSFDSGPLYVDASVSFGYHMFNADRDLLALGLNPESDFDGYDITAYLRGGYDIEIADNVFVSPNASVQYTYVDYDGFSESNLGTGGLSVEDRDADSLRTRLGVELSAKFEAGLVIVPSVFGGWEREWSDDTDNVDASFNAGGLPFSVDTGPREEDLFFVGLGVNVLFHQDVSGFLRLERSFGDDEDIDSLAGGLTFRF